MQFARRVWLLCAVLTLAACGGGGSGGDEGFTAPPANVNTVSGFVVDGGPVANALVFVDDGVRRVTANTDGAGRYTLTNLGQFQFPVTITARSPARPAVPLQTVVLPGQTVAHITSATTAISRVLAAGSFTATEVVRVSRNLQTALGTYLPPRVTVNFFSDPNFQPNQPGQGAALDAVQILEQAGNIQLRSRFDPTLLVEFNPANANPPVLPRPADNQLVDTAAVSNLVRAFDQVFRSGNLSTANLRNVLHEDFQDDNGFRAENFAQVYNNPGLVSVAGFEVLRCMPDQGNLFDRCTLRLYFARPLTRFAEDFNNSNFTQVIRREAYDLMIERRASQTNPLRFAGGVFRPFAVQVKQIVRNSQLFGPSGIAVPENTIQPGAFIAAPVAPPDQFPASFGQLVNSNLVRAELLRIPAGQSAQSLFDVQRVVRGQCAETTSSLVRNPGPADSTASDCGVVALGSFANALPTASVAGELRLSMTQSLGNQANVVLSEPLRIDTTEFAGLNDFPVLDVESLSNLHAYSTNPAQRLLVITLRTPDNRQSVCISTGLEAEPICVYGQRRISLSPDQLGKARAFLLSSEDSAGNVIQRQYIAAAP